MSGDVQPRKRKEKRRKKDSEEIPTSFTSDEQLHVHKDASTGGNICAKILFFLLSFVLLVMIGLVVFEYRGSTDDETLVPVSKWAPTFDGWLETPVKHDEHADVTESGEQEHGESGEHETESAEGEDHLSEEAVSKEEDDDEDEEDEGGGGAEEEEDDEKGSEEEDTKSGEEEEEEDEDEEADKLKDEESEEVDENEIEDRDEDEEQDEEEEEGSEEDVDDHGKSEEDAEAEKEGQDDDDDDDDDDDGEEEDEEEDAEDGREELDEEEEEERDMPAYQRESDEIDDLLSEIPGITESDEDEEGDNLGRSDEIITKQQKIPGVHEKKIKSVSEEEVEVPRRKQEKEVSETTQPVEGTSTVTVGQKPQEQHKSQDQGQAELKAHQSAVKEKAVTEKPVVAKREKHEALHPQEQLALKSNRQTHSKEHPALKNDGFPSGPGETGQGQKAGDASDFKVTPPKKQKVGVGTTKDSTSEGVLSKKQKDSTGPALKSEPSSADPIKPTVPGGKNFKDKDVSTDGLHSPPKASRIGDKVEHSLKVEKSATVNKVIEQSSPTKLDANDRVPVSKSPHVDKSTETLKKTVNSKDRHGSKSEHSASASGVKNNKFDTKDAQTTTDDTVKKSDLKTEAHGTLGTAENLASSDKKIKASSNGKEKESVTEQPIRESGNLNSQKKQMKVNHSTGEKKLAEKKVENLRKNKGQLPNREKGNHEKFTSNLDHDAETGNRVAAKESSGAKVDENLRKSKVDIEKEKASAKTSGDEGSEVPVKVSSDKVTKVSVDNTKNGPPGKSADVNAARKQSGNDNAQPEGAHRPKSRDAKVSAVPEQTLKHSVRKDDSSETRENKPVVQSAANRRDSRGKEEKPIPTSESQSGQQENGGNNKPLNSNIKKPSHGQKAASKQTENEVTQPESEKSSKGKAVPSQRDSDMVK